MRGKFISIVLLASVCAAVLGDFTFVVIPDTQHFSVNANGLAIMRDQTEWVIAQKDALNIVFAAHLGDMTESWSDPSEWNRAEEAMDVLKADGTVPYSVAQGNHDYIGSLRERFPVSDWEGKPWFGGYLGGMENAYYLFTADGMDFIIVVIQTHDQFIGVYDWASINWANDLFDQYSDRRAIFVTHDFYENPPLRTDVIDKHDNLFLAVCGHSCGREAHWTETSPGGNAVHCILSDYQCDNPETGLLRYYVFKTLENRICAYTYCPSNDTYETDANSQFCFDYEMFTGPSLSISASATTIELGDSVDLTATINNPDGGEGPIAWTVSAGGSLSASSGATTTLSASAEGNYTVTATSGDLTSSKTIEVVDFSNFAVKINCGGPAVGDDWVAGASYITGGSPYDFGGEHDLSKATDPAPNTVYQTVQHFDHTISLPFLPNGDYRVRLHFTDQFEGRTAKYDIEGTNVLNDFDIIPEAGGTNTALIKEFDVTVSDGNGLQIVGDANGGMDVLIAGCEIARAGTTRKIVSSLRGTNGGYFNVSRTHRGEYNIAVNHNGFHKVDIVKLNGATVASFDGNNAKTHVWKTDAAKSVYIIRLQHDSRVITKHLSIVQ